jgi:hypothetical protein
MSSIKNKQLKQIIMCKNKFYLLIIATVFSIAITGCDDTTNEPALFTNGVFVINEGAFGNSNCEVTFIQNDNSVNNNLYAANNNSAILGDVLQSMAIANGNAYLVVNNSNKVEVTKINNLQNKGTITGFSMPRYMVTYNGKGYISEWTSFGSNGKIKVIDISNNTITDSVTVGMLPENLMVVGSSILVANSGDTTLHLVNTSNLTTTNIGDVDYPKYITKTNDGNIWVLYTGKPAWSGTQTDGGLLVLNSTATAIVKNINIGSTATYNPSQLTSDGTNVYYEYQGDIYKIDQAATVAPATPFITAPATSLYGLSYYSSSNVLYVADAGNFSSSGTVKKYNALTGVLLDTYNVGVAPNGFVYN